LYTADAPDLKQAAGELKDSWIKLGAGVDVKVFEPSELYQNIIRTRAYDALLFGEAAGRDNDLFAFWHSSQRNAPGLNVAMYANSKVDKILEGIRSATGTDAMAASYAELDQMIGADFPAVFLYAPDFVYAVPKALKGVDLGVMTAPADRFGSVSDWYLGTERVWKIFAK
jgi:peptide/nickel transport system substrate-binding protein